MPSTAVGLRSPGRSDCSDTQGRRPAKDGDSPPTAVEYCPDMRLVTWNVARRGASSALPLAELEPDVVVLPEWGRLPMSAPDGFTSLVEFGKVGEFGLAVAARGEWSVTRASLPAITGEVIGGVEVDGPSPFRLVAVWSCFSGKPKPAFNPVTEAITSWSDWLTGWPVVVAGDFNTGGWWQEIRDGSMSHFPIVDQLDAIGMHSAYHVARGIGQGVDEEPTHWHSRGGRYMIDHVFTPRNWQINSVVVGAEEQWRERSDHAPVVVDVTPN